MCQKEKKKVINWIKKKNCKALWLNSQNLLKIRMGKSICNPSSHNLRWEVETRDFQNLDCQLVFNKQQNQTETPSQKNGRQGLISMVVLYSPQIHMPTVAMRSYTHTHENTHTYTQGRKETTSMCLRTHIHTHKLLWHKSVPRAPSLGSWVNYRSILIHQLKHL